VLVNNKLQAEVTCLLK